jgi:uncharacterized secreted protein with C-terminal beta-propeller domain
MLNYQELMKNAANLADLGRAGIEDTAYIKTVILNGKLFHAIHAADGTPLTVVNGREIALATILQHNMHPVSVH